MERAKRLELNAGKSETSEQSAVVNSANATDTQLSTHAAELAEIVSAWPRLSPEIRVAMLTLVRVAAREKSE
jgi:uncharacterized protein with PhoU and TrkA domain